MKRQRLRIFSLLLAAAMLCAVAAPVFGSEGEPEAVTSGTSGPVYLAAVELAQTLLLAETGTPQEELGLPGELYAADADGAEHWVRDVLWFSTPPYDPSRAGEYLFSPYLPEGYEFLPDTPIPVISVSTEDPPPVEEEEVEDEVYEEEEEEPEEETVENEWDAWRPMTLEAPAPVEEPEATTLTVVPVDVCQPNGDVYRGLPNPRIWVDHQEIRPNDSRITKFYSPTIGNSEIPPTNTGYYTITVVYTDNVKTGTGSDSFYIAGPEGSYGDITYDTYVSESDKRALRSRIRDVSGFSSISSSRIEYFDLHGSDRQRVTLPYPSGTDRHRHEFVIAHLNNRNRVEIIHPREEYWGLTFTVDSFSPFALAWRVDRSDDWWWDRDDDNDDYDYSSFKPGEYDFWMDVRRKIERADDGDTVKVRARGYDKLPEVVMRALRRNDGVSLLIEWNGGGDIFIPAGEAQYADGLRVYWPLRLLESLYAGSSIEEPDKEEPNVPSESEPPAPPIPPSSGSGKPSAGMGGYIEVNAPDTPEAESAPATSEREGRAKSVTEARSLREQPRTKAIVTGGEVPASVSSQPEPALPEALVLAVVVLCVLALFGVFIGVWLFSKKSKLKY